MSIKIKIRCRCFLLFESIGQPPDVNGTVLYVTPFDERMLARQNQLRIRRLGLTARIFMINSAK